MRNKDKEQVRELLREVTFTKEKAFLLCSYAFICTLCGLLAFAYLTKSRYEEVQEELCAKISSTLFTAGSIEGAVPTYSPEAMRFYALSARIPLGPGMSAEKTPLLRVKGQRRQLDERTYEFRFIAQD